MSKITIPEVLDRAERLNRLAHSQVASWKNEKQWAEGARDCLQECLGGVSFDPVDLLEASMFRQGPKPTFPSLGFSHHPLTLWSSDEMSLDVYYWHPGETTLHDHGFHGAFMPVMGDYAEVVYDYKMTVELGMGVEQGELTKKTEQEVLPNGQAVAIYHAPAFIHQVSHQSFCVTICLRSRFSGLALSDYYFPGIKICGHAQQAISAREDLQRLALLKDLRATHVQEYLSAATLGTLARWWLKDICEGMYKPLKPLIEAELLRRPHGEAILAARLVL